MSNMNKTKVKFQSSCIVNDGEKKYRRNLSTHFLKSGVEANIAPSKCVGDCITLCWMGTLFQISLWFSFWRG